MAIDRRATPRAKLDAGPAAARRFVFAGWYQVKQARSRRRPAVRISALRQLVLQVPVPVIADALGFHHATARRHLNAGAPWSRYAAGGRAPQ
jgi:hypothetical protein